MANERGDADDGVEAQPTNLVCVVGGTPAVVTETIYALAVAPALEDAEASESDRSGAAFRRPAADIQRLTAVTTTVGREKLQETLAGALDRMARDYPDAADRLPKIPERMVYAIPKSDSGEPLSDVRTTDDSAAMADRLDEVIRRRTADEEPALHVSLAGGRKTMGYFAGHAMIFHGRRQDRLSHVLVSEDAESSPEFMYPTPDRRMMKTYDGTDFDASEQEVDLHELPFVRLRGRDAARDEMPTTFRAVVEAVQAELDENDRLEVNLDSGRITYGETSLQLTAKRAALFAAIVVYEVAGEPKGATDLVDASSFGPVQLMQTLYDDAFHGESTFSPPSKTSIRTKVSRLRQYLRQKKLSEVEAEFVGPTSGPDGYRLELASDRIDIVDSEGLLDGFFD